MKKGAAERPDCRSCRHYYVTWDANFPRGCRALGFKGRKDPGLSVFESSGMACQLFEPRDKPEGGPGGRKG